MRTLLTATAIGLVISGQSLAAPQPAVTDGEIVLAQAQQRDVKQKGTKAGAQSQSAQPLLSRIPILPAREITGRPVRDASGQTAGQVEYVLFSMETGEIRQVVLGSGGSLDIGDELTALPWSSVKVMPLDGPIVLNTPIDKIRRAPRIGRDALSELTKPSVVTAVIDHYAPAPGRINGQSQAQSQAGERETGEGTPRLLVGRTMATALVPPALARTGTLAGAHVRTQGGKEFGEIDRVIVDPANGRVAFVLVAHGGFLGIGEDWTPMPLTALRWTPEENTFAVNMSDADLRRVGTLKRENLPTTVSAAQVDQLYSQFGLKPYRQQLAVSPDQTPEGAPPAP